MMIVIGETKDLADSEVAIPEAGVGAPEGEQGQDTEVALLRVAKSALSAWKRPKSLTTKTWEPFGAF
jgi:hypothetical protein